MARRRRSLTILIALVALIAGTSAYFLGVNPIWGHINEGLDLKGGLNVIYQAVSEPSAPVTPTAMRRTLSVIRYRVDKLGVAEPYIQQEGSNRIVIELPGIQNPDSAIKVIGRTALLQFKDSKGQVIVTGSHLQSAQAEIQQGQGNVVALQFDPAGAQAIANFTSHNVGKHMAIYLDNKMVQDPVVQQAIPNGQAIVTGYATLKDAQNIAIELNSGALPLKLNMIENQSISPTLGAESIQRSLEAAAVAVALIVAFMVTLYRIPGLWADLALAVYSVLLLGGLYAIHATLTLPGITGIILSIGMCVDANVIIYERTREELRAGRTLRSSVDAGFHHGLRAVIDGHVTALISCFVLYALGTGEVRGFAVTLGMGVLISLLTAVVLTQYMLHRLVDAGARPSFWFFSPQGTPQPVGGPALAAAAAGGPAVAFGNGGSGGRRSGAGQGAAKPSVFRARVGAIGPDAETIAAQSRPADDDVEADPGDLAGSAGGPEAAQEAATQAAATGAGAAGSGQSGQPGKASRKNGARGKGGGSRQRRNGGSRKRGG